MSVFWDTGFGKCFHCGETIQLHTFKKKENVKQYAKPNLSNIKADYSDKFINYVTNVRSIDINALKQNTANANSFNSSNTQLPQVM